MPVINQFSPPGNVDDLLPANRKAWSDFLTERFFIPSKAGNPAQNDGPRSQFFIPTVDDVAGPPVEQVITWTAFPRQVTISSGGDVQRWRRADKSRQVQDEYCEWSVHRNAAGKIMNVDFTSEGPEYWIVLAQLQPETVLQRYRQLVSPAVDMDDLFPNGEYHPFNQWNSSTDKGIVHLIQGANTLGAEIELAAGASVVRRRNGTLVTGVADLIQCSRYGAAERHSDPHIGASANALARAGHRVSLADPVGLFIAGCDFSGFELPTGNVNASQCFKVVRGVEGRALRVRFAPPDGETFTVSDVRIDGRPIEFGGQIADKMTVGLAAWASADKNHLKEVDGCRAAAQLSASMSVSLSPFSYTRS
jgi:hypothetical protein